jgi:hypothetical protein
MVATTTEEPGMPTVVSEIDCTIATTLSNKMGGEATTPVAPKTPTPLEIAVDEEEEKVPEERTDSELSPRDDSDNGAVKYGFGAGMRMYAKSLAMAEKQEAGLRSKVVDHPVVAVKALSPKATLSPKAVVSPKTAVSPKVATPKAEAAVVASPQAAVASPKSEPAALVDPPAMEIVPMTTEPAPAAVTTEVVKSVVTAVPPAADEVAALPKSIACGSIFTQVQDFLTEFFRKTEDVVDDCHERVCNRDSTACASTAMKTVASSEQADDKDDEMVEKSSTAVAVEGETAAASPSA